MEDKKLITGATEAEVWQTIDADLNHDEIYNYDVLIQQGGKSISLIIDIDLGGGFESGWENTQIASRINLPSDFRFAIHDDTFIDEVGKFFGMQDVELGYPELDKHLIVKTNHEEKVRSLFADAEVRNAFLKLDDFDFGIHTHHPENSDNDVPYLELNIDQGITDAAILRQLYHAFYQVLTGLEA